MAGNPSAAPARNQAFQRAPSPQIRRAVFDLSHEKKLTFDFGQLIPSLCMEMVPGDSFEMSNDMIVRFQAMLAPLLHQVDATIHYFFVPTRLLWPKIDTTGQNWESFISGGVDGLNAAVAPRWDVGPGHHDIGSLWDYFGLPTWATADSFSTHFNAVANNKSIIPLDFPKRAYNLIWNEFYRDETLESEVDIATSEVLLLRNWTKDYFTSALPWQQRGTAPALPIAGATSAVWTSGHFYNAAPASPAGFSNSTTVDPILNVGNGYAMANAFAMFNANTVDLSTATSMSIADFRLAASIQKWLERNATGGARYTEFLQAQFGVFPRDERLQRPEYVGGAKSPVIFNEVLQTSATNAQPTPAGNMAGHGLSVGRNYVGKYSAVEYGYMIGILSVMPVPAYQDGVPRMFNRVSKYDWYFPDFAQLSEQAVLNQELYLGTDNLNKVTFGYQARYNEYRYERSSVHGLFRTDLSFWHLGRIFGSRPNLNAAFVSLSSAELASLKRVAAVPSQPLLLASVGNNVRAVRPMPELAVPGIDRV